MIKKKVSFVGEKRFFFFKRSNFHKKSNYYLLLRVFCNFYQTILDFVQKFKNSEHLNVLWRLFLFQMFFKILMLIFGHYLRRKMCFDQSDFGETIFLLKFYFLSSLWIYKLFEEKTGRLLQLYLMNLNQYSMYNLSNMDNKKQYFCQWVVFVIVTPTPKIQTYSYTKKFWIKARPTIIFTCSKNLWLILYLAHTFLKSASYHPKQYLPRF